MNPRDMDEDQLLASSSSSSSSSDEEGESGPAGTSAPIARAGAASFFGTGEEDDSDSESESDEEMEVEAEEDVDEEGLSGELSAVVDKLAAEPYSYDLHLEKIKLLKKLGDAERLRSARERMSDLYPLSPSLWVEWLEDEMKMVSVSTDEEKEYVFGLMEKAVKDYASVEVWLQYINLCLSNMSGGDVDGVSKCRDVFERAISACGLNVAMGSLIWDTYRDFEFALMSTFATEEVAKVQIEAQEKKYIALCKRQLSVPLLDMKHTYEQLAEKIDLDENTEIAYKKAVDRLEALEEWEAKLVQASDDSKKLEIYLEYIKEERKVKSNPARIQCLYERAITDSPLSYSTWLEYIDYLSFNLKIPEVVLSVCERASRNCPWILSVWTKFLWAVETYLRKDALSDDAKADPVFDKAKSVFESALVYCGSTGDQAGTLWIKYLEFLKRRIDLGSPDEKKLEILRKTFSSAELHLVQIVYEPNEYLGQILQFHARFEAQLAQAMTKEVREIWKSIISRGYGCHFRFWNQYITQELKYGADPKKARELLSKAMSQVTDDPQSASDMWLNFERDWGDLTTLTSAETKIAKELEKVAYQQPIKTETSPVNQRQEKERAKKRKWGSTSTPNNETFPPIKKEKMETRLKRDQESTPFKVPQLPSVRGQSASNKADDKSAKDRKKPAEASKEPVVHDPAKDDQTVFASNLDFAVGEDELKTFFEECGNVEEIRLVRKPNGTSRGFAYVVFNTTNSATKALELDRKMLGNRPVFVSKCDPDKSTRPTHFNYSTDVERNKLFIKGLPPSTTEEELKKMFEVHGPVKACRLPTTRAGNLKGIAYVDFEKTADASAAILKTDGTTVDGRIISVAISHPPSKNAPRSLAFTSRSSVEVTQRHRNAFVPRSLQVKPVAAEQQATTTTSTLPSAPKSNDDFRKLFLKK